MCIQQFSYVMVGFGSNNPFIVQPLISPTWVQFAYEKHNNISF